MIRVAVLFGGQSGEHEVSLVSGHAVMQALDPATYEVIPIGITRAGTWIAGADALPTLLAAADPERIPAGVEWDLHHSMPHLPRLEQRSEHGDTWHPSRFFTTLGIDVVFPVLHGPMGEDGTIQGMLEVAGIPYVGCGVAASAISMDKGMTKAVCAAAGIPQLPWLLVQRHELQQHAEHVYQRIEQHLGYPVFVKPANMGSSIGISKASTRHSLAYALAGAAHYDRRVVVEQGIDAREIEVSVLGNSEPEASIAGEIVPADEWYTYEAKYLSGKSRLCIPAPLEADLMNEVRTLACRAFSAVDGAGLARVDFLLERASNKLWFNEINTMPGFTPISMYAKLWAASGMAYGVLVGRLVELALATERRAPPGQHSQQSSSR